MMGHCAMPTESVSDGGVQVGDSSNVRPENISRRANTRKRKNASEQTKLFPAFNSSDIIPKYVTCEEVLCNELSYHKILIKYGGCKRALVDFSKAVECEDRNLPKGFFVDDNFDNFENESQKLFRTKLANGPCHNLIDRLKSADYNEQILKEILVSFTSTDTSQQEIAEKAKQEAYVWQRVSELQRYGLWSEKRLPKVYEAPKGKAHWDYVLEEVQWLATDFAQERKWKKVAAKKCAKMVQKHFQEREASAQKAARAAELHTRKVAAHMAKLVRTFWSNAEKLVEYRQQTKIEEKRKKALDQHLSFIVDQTEKFSSLVAESMNMNKLSSMERLPIVPDAEFEPYESSSDDEATIEEEEKKNVIKEKENKEEIEMLERESQLPIEDIIKELPEEYFNTNETVNINNSSEDGDESYSSETDISDDESTIIQEEQMTRVEILGGSRELAQLKADNNMSIEELMREYNHKSVVINSNSDDYDMDEEDAMEDENGSDGNVSMDGDSIGLSSLFENEDLKKLQNGDISNDISSDTTEKDIDDAAAIAESLQPKGNTLSSTSVVTKVPHLLKLSLREYQHIGLDWLVTMYERNLNGILADEMGLGKTIQTIALLAHLACEKEIWGPHLIIVPTSVILNWEMELKKWCPAFKIITYFGNPKERKMKRIGWTKPNTFHICITSYKLVVQDHQSFRRKKWQYLILDEAQNIKNFKSQRWQMLLNFQTERRLLLTGTPLQNNLMELWSLMHFLMPNLFASHREFKEWFSNPVTGMIEGNSEYNENIIKRLHKVLRPFLLRRLKTEVEKQLPKKFEHVVLCRLSNRQRFLYDDFMSRTKTKETLASGNLLSVINVLMQLRKVCNHPNLFETRPVISPFQMAPLNYVTASMVAFCTPNFIYNPFETVTLMNTSLIDNEGTLSAYVVHRTRRYATSTENMIQYFQEYERQVATNTTPVPPPKTKISFRLKTPRNLSCLKLPDTVWNKEKVQSLLSFVGKIKTDVEKGQEDTEEINKVNIKPAPLIKALIAQGEVNNMSVKKNKCTKTLLDFPKTVNKVHSNVNSSNKSGNNSLTTGTQLVKNIFPITIKGKAGGHVVTNTSTSHKISIGNNFTRVLQTTAGKQVFLPGSSTPPTTVKTASGQRIVIRNAQATTSASITTTSCINSSAGSTGGTNSSNIFQMGGVRTKTGPIIRIAPVSSITKKGQANNACSSSQAGSAIINQSGGNILRQVNVKLSKLKDLNLGNDKSSYLRIIDQRRKDRQMEKLRTLGYINKSRTRQFVAYGKDVRETINIDESVNTIYARHITNMCSTLNVALNGHPIFHSAKTRIQKISDSLSEFVVCVPSVRTQMPALRIAHMTRDKASVLSHVESNLNNNFEIMESCNKISEIMNKMSTSFPDNRLLQYDCGKLQTLDLLLQRLKQNDHRVLIFTQMSKMLDVLEAFLTFHGHIYLRLDGSTKIEQRQLLMERFNADKRFFCFILSTRSGGVGINLTGADTVIFYDSDWNPTMDAQAQDRCHRIGQTRDVHIYRLISEKTIEENILKKANQKRLLGDLAIEGGNFTTAYFKCSATIHDLFNVDFEENDPAKRMRGSCDVPLSGQYEKSALHVYETALAAAEDEPDVAAANVAKEEAVADMEEFDEDIPLTEGEDGQQLNGGELSKAEQELNILLRQLSPIERWAVNFMETTDAEWAVEQLAIAEAEIEQQKKEWEIERRATIKRADEQSQQLAAEQDDLSCLLTYSRCDANQTWISFEDDMEAIFMPIWIPLDYDMEHEQYYVDRGVSCMYESFIMTEDQLPPVYVKKERKKSRKPELPAPAIVTEQPNQSKVRLKGVKDNTNNIASSVNNKATNLSSYSNASSFTVYDPPCSLFDWPSSSITKLRQDMRFQKYKGMSRSSLPCISGLKSSSKNQNEYNLTEHQHVEWSSLEDNALLQAMKYYLDIPMNLSILYPAHQPNWDFVASTVNFVCGNEKTPMQCRYRFDILLRTRDDCNVKRTKRRKTSLPVVSVQQDISFTQSSMRRFSKILNIQSERRPPHKSLPFPTPWIISHNDFPIRTTNIDYSISRSPTLVVAARQNRAYKEKQELQLQQQQIMIERKQSLRMLTTPTTKPGILPEYSQQRLLSMEKMLLEQSQFDKDKKITFSQQQGRKRKSDTKFTSIDAKSIALSENKSNTVITKREIQLQQLQHEKRIIRVHHPLVSASGVPVMGVSSPTVATTCTTNSVITPKVLTVTRSSSTSTPVSSRVIKVGNRLIDASRLQVQAQIETQTQARQMKPTGNTLFKKRQGNNNDVINASAINNNRQDTMQSDSSDLASIYAHMLPYSPNSSATECDVDAQAENDTLFNEEEIGELLRKDPSLDSIVTKFLANANVNDIQMQSQTVTGGALEPVQMGNSTVIMPSSPFNNSSLVNNSNSFCNDITQVNNANILTNNQSTAHQMVRSSGHVLLSPNNRFTMKQTQMNNMGVRQSLISQVTRSGIPLQQRINNNHSPRFRIPRMQTQHQLPQNQSSFNTLNRVQMPLRNPAACTTTIRGVTTLRPTRILPQSNLNLLDESNKRNEKM